MTDANQTTAYYEPLERPHNARLTEVGRGTPMGELMRRYWHPVGLSEDATELPRQVRALGEDLILFRTTEGEPGLVAPHCVHRGTSLFYGKVTDCGIRCPYHGWMFGTDGQVLERPAEPHDGPINAFRQPWYPVEERYGLIFAYMGPMDKKPLLPRYNVLEELAEGEQLYTDANNIGGGGKWGEDKPVPFNWLQHYENIHDLAHFYWLHYLHSGPQFGDRFGEMNLEALRANLQDLVKAPVYSVNERGVENRNKSIHPDGSEVVNIVETVFPTLRCVPNPLGEFGALNQIGWVLPVDDTNFRIYTVLRGKDRSYFDWMEAAHLKSDNKTVADRQRYPNDFEAQSSQGPITSHAKEHLGFSDKAIVMLRRLFEEQIKTVEEGGNPIGTHFTPGEEYVRLDAGTWPLSGPAKEAMDNAKAESVEA